MRTFPFFIFIFLVIGFVSISVAQEDLKVVVTNSNYADAKLSYSRISNSQARLSLIGKDGEPVKTLTRNDIKVVENGWEAEITKVVPLSQATGTKINVVLVLDNSSSMAGYADDLLQILDTLVSSFSELTQFKIITFNEKQFMQQRQYKDKKDLYVDMISFDSNDEKVKDYYSNKYQTRNMSRSTYLCNQIYASFRNSKKAKDGEAEDFFIFFSDGNDVGSSVTIQEALAEYKGGKVYIIDFNREGYVNPVLLKLKDASNGEYFKPDNAVQMADFFKTVGEKIIFSGYEVTFESNVPPAFVNTNVFEFKNNQFMKFDKINIEEVKAREFFPILNYVFFDEGSSDMQAKYKLLSNDKIFSFTEQSVPADQMSVYYNVLNITGFRMKNSNSNLTVIGCNSDSEDEKGNTTLSKDRAVTVQDYLVNIWGIDPSRIKIAARNLPEKASTRSLDEGKAENRRVELVSDDPHLFDAIELNHNTYLVDPNSLQIKPQILSRYKINKWTLTIKQENNILYEKNSEEIMPDVIRLNLLQNLDLAKLKTADIIVELSALNERGIKSIPFTKRYPLEFKSINAAQIDSSGGKNIEKVSLVLFDFNTSNLGKKNEMVLEKVKDAFTSAKKIDIKGYTDNIGSDAYNLKLSDQRAKSLNKSLITSYGLKIPIDVEGLGEMSPLYDNETPEGRFYNRTCQMIIEFP